MEPQDSSIAYDVEVGSLQKPAGKPRHLEERFKARKRRSSSSLLSVLSTHQSANKAFIEARRTKLQRRHNHIQKVLSAHRDSLHADDPAGRKKIQETLEAAEMNRKNILDRQAKTMATKVAHAREVAAAQQKIYEEAQLARRQALEDRLRASEARRRAYQATPRARRLHPNEILNDNESIHEPMQDSAASSIQRWWRGRHMRSLVSNWTAATKGLTPASAKGISFDALVALIQNQEVIRSASKILATLWRMVDLVQEQNEDEESRGRTNLKKSHRAGKRSASSGSSKKVAWKTPSRVFLSAFIIVEHTSEIMPTIAAEEETVKKNAEILLGTFQKWMECAALVSDQDLLTETLEFLKAWKVYYESFNTWKERDTKKIVDDLVSHWMNLERLWLSVKDQVDADAQWRPRIEQQQKVILNRLTRFGESALERLREERRLSISDMEIDDEPDVEASPIASSSATSVPIKIPGAERKTESPLASSPMDILSTSPQRFPPKMFRKRLDSVTAQSPVRGSSSRSPSARNQPGERSQSRPSTPASIPDEMDATSTTEPTPAAVSVDLAGVASTFGSNLSNEQLAHELTLDPEFSLKKPQLSPLEESVRAHVRKAFFDSVQEAFDKFDYATHVPDFIADIRKQLLAMVSETGKISTEIKEILDLDMVKQQIDKKIMNFKALLLYIATKMGQLCAPLRDAAIRSAIANIKNLSSTPFAPTPAVEGAVGMAAIFDSMLQILDDMKLDLANYRLQSLRPYLRPQAAEYERSKFAKALEKGEVTLERTKAWLQACTKEKEDIARSRNPENVDIPENKIKYTDIFHEAILGYVFTPPTSAAAREAALPETLVLDAARLHKFQEEGQRLNITAGLLTLTQNLVREVRGDRAAMQGLKDALLVLLTDSEGLTVDNLSAQIISNVQSAILSRRTAINSATGKQVHDAAGSSSVLGAEREEMIRSMVARILSTGKADPILGLLRRRIQALVKSHIVSGLFKREGLERAGLDLVKTELEAYSAKVATWVKFNGEVYSQWYDGILREIVG
ncbi:hypothetical protein HDU97_009192 [Phlyctochytrium planicorne]|nr:hypothetical protein HDU97_009192 [Phlyctochytrium planicorne]